MLRDLQDEIKELLQGDPYFADVTSIVTVRDGYIPAEIEKAKSVLTGNSNNKVGLAIEINLASMKTQHPNVPGPQLDEIAFVVSVVENVTINTGTQGIGKSCEDVIEYVIATLHGRLLETDRSTLLHVRTERAPDDKFHVLDAFFRCEGRLLYQPEQVETPVLS